MPSYLTLVVVWCDRWCVGSHLPKKRVQFEPRELEEMHETFAAAAANKNWFALPTGGRLMGIYREAAKPADDWRPSPEDNEGE